MIKSQIEKGKLRRLVRLIAVNTLVFIGFLLVLELMSFSILFLFGEHCSPFYSHRQRNVMPAHSILGWTSDSSAAIASGGLPLVGWIRYSSGISSVDTLRLAVVGGSTSDNVFEPDNWPIKLKEILESEGIAVNLYNGATAGYSSSQELSLVQNYLQDIKPHFLISYSGVNECVTYKRLNNQVTFSSGFANDQLLPNLTVALSKIRDGRSKVHLGGCDDEDGNYLALQWLSNMEEMKSIAEQNGVKFISIVQPSVVTLRPRNIEFESDISIADYLISFYDIVNQNRGAKDFITDLTYIFDDSANVYLDDCHVNDRGNGIVAREVYGILETYQIIDDSKDSSLKVTDEK
jgi:hypothetical protein